MLSGMVQLTEWLGQSQSQPIAGASTTKAMTQLYFLCLNWYSEVIADQSDTVAKPNAARDADDGDLQFISFTQYVKQAAQSLQF